ncbi:MAG: flagellar basal body rod protein FlgB [Proteobacteria bacterium]|nr:MAG: flagellar basal body rod protein FlgB [Pseudomonadota bacterium]
MPINIDSALGIHTDALALRARRAEVLASNLANVDTPNYKARDFDFRTVLDRAQQGAGMLKVSHPAHIPSAGANAAMPELAYRMPLHASLDGNTVDASQEQAAFAENALQYRASLTFLNSRIRGLLTAIRGE